MPGFFVTNTKNVPDLVNYAQERCVRGSMIYKQWSIHWNVLNKYMDDKAFFQDEEAIVLLDGVILNKLELMKEWGEESWRKTLLKMCRCREDFFADFRGVFAGAIYEKQTGKWTVFTDQTNSHLLLTYADDENVAFGTQLNYFSAWMQLNGIPREIDPVWEEDFFTFGTMIDSHCILRGITRIHPGCWASWNEQNKRFQENIYCQMTKQNVNYEISLNEAIEELDVLFRNAIRRIIEKDKEYGYTTLIDVSGGLDSRMIARIASELGENLLFNTYGQQDSPEFKSAKKVLKTINVGSVNFNLNADCLLDIDDLVFMNHGMNYYTGAAGVWRALELIDRDTIGAQCWGLLGDIYEGAMIHQDMNLPPDWKSERYRASTLIPFTPNFETKRWDYEDNELFWFYARGMFAGLNTAFIRQNFVEPITPYGDVEFMRFCFSLPENMRVKKHVYRRWMQKKYPEMSRIPYAATGGAVMANDTIEFVCCLPIKIARKIKQCFLMEKMVRVCVPFDMWYTTDSSVRHKIQLYYENNLEALNQLPRVKEKVQTLFAGEKYIDKAMALTALSAVKQFCGNNLARQ